MSDAKLIAGQDRLCTSTLRRAITSIKVLNVLYKL